MQSLIDAFWAAPIWALWIFIAVVGLCVGSFINVVAYRLPLMLMREWREESASILNIELANNASTNQKLSLCSPASHCRHCHTEIKWYHNIPLFGWLYLRGKCHSCKERISIQYPIVEVATAGLSVLVAEKLGIGYVTIFGLAFLWICITLFVIDLKEQILPDRLVIPLIGIGLVCNMIGYFVPLEMAVSGMLIGFTSLWLINAAFKLVKKVDGMGFGDFKLFAAFGAWFGSFNLIDIILYASLSGAVVGIAYYLIHKKSLPFAFGPHLIFGAMMVFLVPFSFYQ